MTTTNSPVPPVTAITPQITIELWVSLSVDGTDVVDDAHCWNDTSACRCDACGHAGTVADFATGTV